MNFDLKAPCKNCPFIKNTTMVLRPGRMEGIAKDCADDRNVFPCHKTTKGNTNEEGEYEYAGNEQACMGALAYTWKHHRNTPIMARIAIRMGGLTIKDIEANFDKLEEPGKWPTN